MSSMSIAARATRSPRSPSATNSANRPSRNAAGSSACVTLKLGPMRSLLFVILSALLAQAVLAADVTGNWSGKFQVNGADHDTVYLSLKQSANSISGTAGPSADQQKPIQNGRI